MLNFEEFKKKYDSLIEISKKTKINKNQVSNIYKIPLYSFKDGNKPYCVDDDNFDNVFNLMGFILVTIVDSNHVKEIKTGRVIPIIHLIKENDYWTSSLIKCDDLKEDDVLFTISRNQFLFLYQINIRDLNTYLGMENQDLEAIFNTWVEFNKKNIKVKKSIK